MKKTAWSGAFCCINFS